MANAAMLPLASQTSAPVSLDEYLHTSYKPGFDFVQGALEERHVEERSHSVPQGELHLLFRSRRDEYGVLALLEQRVQVRPDRFRVCDFAILQATDPREEIIVTAPLLCLEVLLPEDRLQRAREVLEDYLAMGVQQSWLLDPIYRAAYPFDQRGLQVVEGDRLELAGMPIALNLPALFSGLE